MRAKQFCVLTTTESRAKIWYKKNTFKPGDSVFVDVLFIGAPIVCGDSVFGFLF